MPFFSHREYEEVQPFWKKNKEHKMTLIDFALIPLKKEEAQPKEEGDFLSFQDPFRSEQTQCSRMFFFEAEIYTYIRGNEKRNFNIKKDLYSTRNRVV